VLHCGTTCPPSSGYILSRRPLELATALRYALHRPSERSAVARRVGQAGSTPSPGAIQPGTLTALLQEIVHAPEEEKGGAWDAALRPGAAIGRFELVREIGRGGFGVVWEARDKDLGRRVAFKAVRAGGRTAVREERLLREAESAARLCHPNLVTLFDLGRSEHGPYLVLELLEGRTLEERLAHGALSVREALRVGLEVAKGVAHAHAQGVVHRDLKPGNVFLCDDGQVKVLDFGLAHAFGQRREDGGTPAYMAPEQWEGAPEDERTDVFALGVMLHRMLSGELPFPDDGGRAVKRASRAPALDVAELPALGELVSRMLAKRPVDRPRDGEEVAAALRSFQQELERFPSTGSSTVRARRRPGVRLVGLLAAALAVFLGATAAVTRWLAARHAAPEPTPSVAVLPFVDMSPGKDQEYFADGVAEEILNALAQEEGLHVCGRTSSFSFKGKSEDLRAVGQKLGVATVLEGSVKRIGGQVRITAQLVRTADGFHLWAGTFDREIVNVLAVQGEIAREVAGALQVKLLARGRTASRAVKTYDPEAYVRYLRARELLRSGRIEDARLALRANEEAVRLDPRMGAAWAGLAWAIIWLQSMAGEGTSAEMRSRAFAAAERAIELEPELPDGWLARGRAKRAFLYEWKGALADVEKARKLAPGYALAVDQHALLLLAIGEPRAAVAAFENALQLDPLAALSWSYLGQAHVSAGNHEQARAAFLRALALSPENDHTRWALYSELTAAGRPQEALAVARAGSMAWTRHCGEALAQHSMGDNRASRAALEALVAGNAADSAYQVAEVHAWRGESDLAFEWLDRAAAQRDPGMFWVKTDPLLRNIRGDARWKPFLRKVNLPVD
jgi:serine/threonine-protein kinase